MVTFNHDDGVDVVGHHHIPVDHHVLFVGANRFHFCFSDDTRGRKDYLSVDRVAQEAFLVFGAEGDEVPSR